MESGRAGPRRWGGRAGAEGLESDCHAGEPGPGPPEGAGGKADGLMEGEGPGRVEGRRGSCQWGERHREGEPTLAGVRGRRITETGTQRGIYPLGEVSAGTSAASHVACSQNWRLSTVGQSIGRREFLHRVCVKEALHVKAQRGGPQALREREAVRGGKHKRCV
jgi:hypothetical protein